MTPSSGQFFIFSGINNGDTTPGEVFTLGVDAVAFPFGGTIFVQGSVSVDSVEPNVGATSAEYSLGGNLTSLTDGSGNPAPNQPIISSVFVPAGGTTSLTIDFDTYNGESPVGVSVTNILLEPEEDPNIIPLPASLPLLLGAMGGLGFLGWRSRKS